MHQKQNNHSKSGFQQRLDFLQTAFVDLRNVLSHRNSLIDRDSERSIVMDNAFCADIETCIVTAEGLGNVRADQVHEAADNSQKSATNSHHLEDEKEKPALPRKRLEGVSIGVKEQPREPPKNDAFADALAIKSTYADCDDPEPNFKEGFPPEVYEELIFTLQKEVDRELKMGNYAKAEAAHVKAINHSKDMEKFCGIPFNKSSSMNETMADIYFKEKQYDKAKAILSDLLKMEYEDSDRKWRLYHSLAEVYFEQKRLPEAEKFAERAYIGREKMFGKGHGLILQSAALLVQIYEQQGEQEAAQAFRNLYDSAIHKQRPQISKHIGTRRVKWNPDISININEVNKSGKTPLVTAITCGDEEMLHRVLQNGADLEIRGNDGMSPLMHAVSRGQEKIVDVLLSRGAQVDAPTAEWTPLHKATDMNDLGMMRLLISNNADVEAKAPKKFITPNPSKDARKSGEIDSDEDDDADSENSDASNHGWTPLLRACQNGKETAIRVLLDSGADIEARTPNKATPLICAAEGQDENIIDLLLMRGAEVEAADDFGWKPLHRTTINRGGVNVAQLLLDHDADINSICNYKKTPLHYAIDKADEGMVSFLLRAGANIEARDIAMRTPLHTAIECRSENMVYILLEFGADAKARDKGGRDALGLANHTPRRSPEILKLLTKHKRLGSQPDGRGRVSSIAGGSISSATISETSPSMLSTDFSSGGSTVVGGSPLASPVILSPSGDGGASSSTWWKRSSRKKKDR